MRIAFHARCLMIATLFPFATACGGGGASPAPAEPLRVMTRNVYYGADLDPAIAAVESGDPEAIVAAVTQVWGELGATDFTARAQALAAEIEAHRPDLIGLQEVALWRTQSPSDTFSEAPTPATTVALDMLQVLLDALAARGLYYEVVVVSENLDAEMPFLDASSELADLRITDREVILALSYLPLLDTTLKNPVAGHFENNLVLGSGIAALCGWASVDVVSPRGAFRFVTAHLEAQVPEIRDAQALELLAGPLAAPGDVVLVGDMNDDARTVTFGETYSLLRTAGFRDAWGDLYGGLSGPTCCFDALLVDVGAELSERVDLVLYRGAFVTRSAELVGTDPALRVGGLWPSDHAGVAVAFGR